MKKTVKKVKMIIVNIIKSIYTFFWYHILRKRLKNDNFSIIAPHCIGGVIYHRLGKEFLSPTINLFINDKRKYIDFCLDLKHYLDTPLVFIEAERTYPVAMCGDVEIHFNHYKTKEEALEKWESRKDRVNYDNLFFILDEVHYIREEDLKKFDKVKCKGKVCFTHKKHPEYEWCVQLSEYKNSNGVGLYMEKGNKFTSKNPTDKDFDFVNWLNTGKTRQSIK